jgi:hypothetical protein
VLVDQVQWFRDSRGPRRRRGTQGGPLEWEFQASNRAGAASSAMWLAMGGERQTKARTPLGFGPESLTTASRAFYLYVAANAGTSPQCYQW